MRCEGGPNCGCTLFRSEKSSKRCKSCKHNRNSHYETSDDDSNDDSDSDSNDNTTGKPLTNAKNKVFVSSLVSDLIDNGEYTGAEVETATREARAGLTKRHVGLMFVWSY